jgi:high-affinity nickel-transport protein
MADLLAPLFAIGAAGFGVLTTGLLLGIRHGFDWDHIAAITDITSTTATADLGSDAHDAQHRAVGHVHEHAHGGASELRAHDAGPGAATATLALATPLLSRGRMLAEQRHAIVLGTLYALGHGFVVAVLGLLALAFGALLPEWVDPIMGRVVGVTLLVLGIWVFYSLWQFLRHGRAFRLRSRWMLVFDGVRYAWRRFQARLHGHEHHDPMEMSSYGKRTAFGVGMIHGVGAETGSQVLLIAAVGGAAGQGLGVPMMFAFILGLLLANTLIVVLTATGFVASQLRQPLYIAIGVLAGTFSVVVGVLFLFGAEGAMPDLERFFSFIGA